MIVVFKPTTINTVSKADLVMKSKEVSQTISYIYHVMYVNTLWEWRRLCIDSLVIPSVWKSSLSSVFIVDLAKNFLTRKRKF